MSNERVILCGGVNPGKDIAGKKRAPVNLLLWNRGDNERNVTLKITDITDRMAANLPARFIDLLEIATYIYCADQATTRGGKGVRDYGANWRRQLRFRIPVREPDFWCSSKVMNLLCQTLNFLSEDEYEFTFLKLQNPPTVTQYLDFGPGGATGFTPEEVLLFSGGLDSLGGAVLEAVNGDRPIALVSHRSNAKIASRQRDLVADLSRECKIAPFHVPVWINKDSELSHEVSQRTRSFLYAVLGAVIAQIYNLSRIRFYENGIISINLPISEQVIGARATRTTHPQVLNGFSDIFSEIFEKDFQVENPFLWETKTDVVKLIMEANCRHLIRHSVSCTHVRNMTILHTHCGVCSQCFDRRFATLAAGCSDDDDPEEMYKVNPILDELEEGEQRTLGESFVRTAKEVRGLSDSVFFEKYPESMRVISHIRGMRITDAAEHIFNLHQQHANNVFGVITEEFRKHAEEINSGSLPNTCLLILALPDLYRLQDKPSIPTAQKEVEQGYCRVITRDGCSECTRTEYDELVARCSDFTMFIDGISSASKCKNDGGELCEEQLSPSELEIIAEYIESKRVIRPFGTRAGARCNSRVAARKLFEKARGKVDTKLGRYNYRAFRLHKTTERNMTAYEFAPPSNVSYCLIMSVERPVSIAQ